MGDAFMWAAAVVALAWKVLSSPATLAILLLMILGNLQEQKSILLGIYRRVHLRARREEADDENDDDENDDPTFPPIDELTREEIEMQAARLPRHEGIIRRTARRIGRALGRSTQ